MTAMTLPSALYSVAQVRAFDARAIASQGVTGYELMQRAGAAALRVLRAAWPSAQRVAVACGGGNNGGDGYVLARLLKAAGLEVQVHAVVDPSALRGDARRACDDYLSAGGALEPVLHPDPARCDVIVDALLGTGFRSPLREPFAGVCAVINGSRRPVLALDIPSGVEGDTGQASAGAVRATRTLCFVALKQGLCLEQGPEFSGELLLDDLGVRVGSEGEDLPRWHCLDDGDVRTALPRRARDSHKGLFGHVLVVGGNAGMPGAARLAGEACLRVGAGLVTVATHPAHAANLALSRPELMCAGVADAAALRPWLDRCTVVAIGPGLGQDNWARALLAEVMAAGKPSVIDADALNLLAAQGLRHLQAPSVLTPHPGEAARLLGVDARAVQSDRRGVQQQLCERSGAVVVLKGHGTLVGKAGAIPALCRAGNPGMASAGMGDVLTGAIAGVLAQCRDPWLAACAGVLIHARAGDTLAQRYGARGLLAGDVAMGLTAEANRGE
jgi:NAD(P)H-hydrate epimerase